MIDTKLRLFAGSNQMLNRNAKCFQILLPVLLLTIGVLFGGFAQGQNKPIVFDPNGTTFNEKRGVKNPEYRIVVLDDFIRRYKLVGLSRARIHVFLGIEGINEKPIERLLVKGGNCIDPSRTYLEIAFDSASNQQPNLQKALKYRRFIEHFDRAKPEVTDWLE